MTDAYQPLEASWDNEYRISDTGRAVNERGQPLIVYNFFRSGSRHQRMVRLARWNGLRWVSAGPETGITLGDANVVNRNGRINIIYNDARDRLAWNWSVDGGGHFSLAVTLTRNTASTPWVHVGPRDGVTEDPDLVCNTGPGTNC